MTSFAQLKPGSQFYPIFRGGVVPIKNTSGPILVNCLNDGVQEVYLVDLEKVTEQEFDALARLVNEQCDPSIPLDVAKAEMRQRGLPLRTKHIFGTSNGSNFL